MMWSCPVVQTFWTAINENIKIIFKLDIPFCLNLFAFGDPLTLKHFPVSQADWVQTFLMLGRKLIVTEWKATSLPSVRIWFSQLGIVAAHERLSSRLTD